MPFVNGYFKIDIKLILPRIEGSLGNDSTNHRIAEAQKRPLTVLRSIKADRFDWASWLPGVRSTLVFVERDGDVLLIDKKTGLGQGKVNGPGGKVEPGETWLECARREVSEELEIKVEALKWVAELRFIMSDYPDILCHVFKTEHFEGEPVETREARPFWCPISSIPYQRMWTDDRYWLPQALSEERVLGLFVFEEEELLSHAVVAHPNKERDAQPDYI